MNFFPQLTTGAAGQYPIFRRRRCRTVRNVTWDAHAYKLADSRATRLEWELPLAGLTDGEWNAIQSLFAACEGRLRPFTFLDPAGNLLSSSEDLTASDWQRDPLLEVTAGVADPFDGTRAFQIVNTAQEEQGFTQSLDIPSDYHYCFSLYVRSSAPTTVTLLRYAGTTPAGEDRTVGPAWARYTSAGKLTAAGVGLRVGLRLPPGATVEVFGPQAEAQPGASRYQPTAGPGGVYPQARFDMDALMLTTHAREQHAATIRIVSAPQDE